MFCFGKEIQNLREAGFLKTLFMRSLGVALNRGSECGSSKTLKVEWSPLYGPKGLFKFGEKRPIVCYCTHEQKMSFEGFTRNGNGLSLG